MNNKIIISLDTLRAIAELQPTLTVVKYMEWIKLLREAIKD